MGPPGKVMRSSRREDALQRKDSRGMGERRDVYAKDEACLLGAQHSRQRCVPPPLPAGLVCPRAVQQEHPPGPRGAGTGGDTWGRCF